MQPDQVSPFARGALERMNAMQAAVEDLWGMTFEQYAELCDTNPDEAERVAQRAQERLAERSVKPNLDCPHGFLPWQICPTCDTASNNMRGDGDGV